MSTAPEPRSSCADCQVVTGARHRNECGLARCEATGLRWPDCACQPGDETAAGLIHQIDRFQGVWAMEADCWRLGLYIRFDADKQVWIRCLPTEDGSGPDLERLVTTCRWQYVEHQWVARKAVLYVREARDGQKLSADIKLYRLRRWALTEGFEIVAERSDPATRRGAGFNAALWSLDADIQPPESLAEVLLVTNQKELGADGRARHSAVEQIRKRGGQIASRDLWDTYAPMPLSYLLDQKIDAQAVLGPNREGDEDEGS